MFGFVFVGNEEWGLGYLRPLDAYFMVFGHFCNKYNGAAKHSSQLVLCRNCDEQNKYFK